MALLRSRPLLGSLLIHAAVLVGVWSLSISLGWLPADRNFVVAQSQSAAVPNDLDPAPALEPVELQPPVDEPPVPEPDEDLIPEPPEELDWEPLDLPFEAPSPIPRRPPPPDEERTAPAEPPAAVEPAQEVIAVDHEILDAESQVLHGPAPTYPRRAYQRRIQGEVVLLAQVSLRGLVTDTEIEKSSGHEILDEAAAKALREWRFRPRIVDGHAVPYRARATFQFQLPNATAP